MTSARLVARWTAARLRADDRERRLDLREPSLGGQSAIVDLPGPVLTEGDALEPIPALSWSSEGQSLVYAEQVPAGSRIVRLSLATLNEPAHLAAYRVLGGCLPDCLRTAAGSRSSAQPQPSPEHLGERCRRHTPHPAHELHRPLRDAALVAGRPPALLIRCRAATGTCTSWTWRGAHPQSDARPER